MGLDIETYDPELKTKGPGVRSGGYIVGVSFCLQGDRPYYLPIRHLGGDNLPMAQTLLYLRTQAKHYTGSIVGANFQYDLDFLTEEGIIFPKVKHVRDIQIADPLIYELHNSYSLHSIAKRWGYEGKSEDKLREAAKEFGLDPKKEMWKLPARYVGEYAEDDARLAVEIIQKQEKEIERQDLGSVYELESQLLPVLLKMRRRGVKIDQDKLEKIERWSADQEKAMCAQLQHMTGVKMGLGDVNKKKITTTMLQKIGVYLRQTPSGQPKLDAAVLKAIDHPVAEAIIRTKKLNKLRTTFVKSIRTHMVGGRIHCTFNQLRTHREQGDEAGAKYGRTSSTNPNLQQQPSRDDFAKMWRSIYVPDTELWASADFSQQEPRILTHFAELVGLKGAVKAADAYRNDPSTDNHSMMCRMIYPELESYDDSSDIFQARRKIAKDIFLGLCYGMGGGKLAVTLGLPTEQRQRPDGTPVQVAGPEAQALLDRFDSAVPFVRRLAWRAEERARRRGYIVTLLGRRCRFPVKPDKTFDWTHKALNRLIQGSAADQTKKAMIEVDRAGLPIQLQVHDEICASVESREQAESVARIMCECVKLRVPSKVDLEIGSSWGG